MFLQEMIKEFNPQIEGFMIQLKTLLDFYQPVNQNGAHLWGDAFLHLQVVC